MLRRQPSFLEWASFNTHRSFVRENARRKLSIATSGIPDIGGVDNQSHLSGCVFLASHAAQELGKGPMVRFAGPALVESFAHAAG